MAVHIKSSRGIIEHRTKGQRFLFVPTWQGEAVAKVAILTTTDGIEFPALIFAGMSPAEPLPAGNWRYLFSIGTDTGEKDIMNMYQHLFQTAGELALKGDWAVLEEMP